MDHDELVRDLFNLNTHSFGMYCQKFNNLVRFYCKQANKCINPFVIHSNLEAIPLHVAQIVDKPLTHLIRNCIDHWNEYPEERTRSDKPAAEAITLSSMQDGNAIQR